MMFRLRVVNTATMSNHHCTESIAARVCRNVAGTSEGTHPWARVECHDDGTTVCSFHLTELDGQHDLNGLGETTVAADGAV
jgi:hypothetical protein